jgi:hypothetical protein
LSAVSPTWTVRKGVTDYKVEPDGSTIIYRPNGFSEANMIFDNSDGAVTNTFTEEDEVDVKIGSTFMLHGFITSISTKQSPSRANEIRLRIVDYGGYLAGKIIFEREYKKTLTVETLLTDSSAEVPMLDVNITGLGTSNEELKRQFLGGYVRDAWYNGVEIGGGDYFVDEDASPNVTLQAFARESRDLNESGANQYRIRDIAPSNSWDLIVDHRFPYNFETDVTQRFRKVVVTSGILETYPPFTDELQETYLKDDFRGKDYSIYYTTSIDAYDIDVTEIEPTTFEGATDVGGGFVMPTVKMLVADSSTTVSVLIRPITRDSTGSDFVLGDFGIQLLDYQRLGLFLKIDSLTGQTITEVTIVLQATGGGWTRTILADLDSIESISGTGFTYVEYQLPPNTVDTPTLGWTKFGSPSGILTSMIFTISPSDGYDAESFSQWGKVHFYRRRRGSDEVGGDPATEKIIVDNRNKGEETLNTLATKELARSNVVAKKGRFTIAGNTDFKTPAYMVECDFTQTLGTGRSGQIRMQEIRHFLQAGVHYTTIFFNNSFQRL